MSVRLLTLASKKSCQASEHHYPNNVVRLFYGLMNRYTKQMNITLSFIYTVIEILKRKIIKLL